MTSLTEVYEGGAGGDDLRRLYVGVGLFLVGAALTVAGVTVGASAAVSSWAGLGVFEAREVAGVLGGLGPPLAFLGIVIVLPQAGRLLRVAAVAGALLALVGVGAFALAYPEQWYRDPTDYTLPVVTVYALGALTTFWCLFSAVASFKTRNDPGGTVRLEVTRGGRTRVVEVSNDRLRRHLGGIGLLGATPDGDAETQTARGGRRRSGTDHATVYEGGSGDASGRSRSGRRDAGPAGASDAGNTVSDGGAAADPDLRTPGDDAELVDGPEPTPRQDAYCGNCAHFRYVRTGDGLAPYCGLDEAEMEDMDACERWTPNNR